MFYSIVTLSLTCPPSCIYSLCWLNWTN